MGASVRSHFRVPEGIRTFGRKARGTGRKDQPLKHELAAYTSQEDQYEMEAILDRYDDTKTKKIRRIFSALHRR
jgi:hypothetical protein